MQADWMDVLKVMGIVVAVGLILAMLVAAWVFYKVRRINLPVNADFFDALRATPFSVVLLLDLLDLSLDFFSAPISWAILSRLGLLPLRAVTVIESFIPGTQALPTMTIAWFIARIWRRARLPAGSPVPPYRPRR
jgi:hypothetical protein